ncbi:MAG: hypothetical protein HOV81_00185 [Kofleriaceae bacterium]|nr:hypothetical protein [Kofleriaceae bacterium]
MSTNLIPRFSLSEPGVSDPKHYRRRVTWLAIIHAALFLTALTGDVLLAWRGEFFVTLAQRSNVETLTIAFFLVLFAYFAFVTAPGALGAVRIGWFHVRARLARDRARLEAQRVEAMGKRTASARAAFDRAVELEGAPGKPWEIEIRDEVASLGRLRFDGVRVEQLGTFRASNTFLGYVEQKLRDLTRHEISIVQWASTHEQEYLMYVASTEASRSLGAALGVTAWPTLVLSEDTRKQLEREVSEVCGALRDEAFLPDWEFEGEHKLPIIPEPLGIISLSRSERRVDPLSSMTAALITIGLVVGLICFFLARPPWIPGR